MKLKGLSKIAIAGAALAATAATLGTSTYAWYVSNIEATATGVVAQMQDSSGGSVYISKDSKNFKSSVVYDDTDFIDNNDFGNVNAQFFPVTTTDGLAFKDLEGTADDGHRLVVSTWINADKDITVLPRLGVVNNSTASAVQQTLYADINDNYRATQTLAVDAVFALRMALFVDDAATPTIYDVAKIAKNPAADYVKYTKKSGFADDADLAVSTQGSKGAAHDYYEAVTGETLTTDQVTPAAATESWGTISLTADTPVKLKFVFWLEGADPECFDSCAGQNISFTFDFIKS